MDIDNVAFPSRLLDVLDAISQADFVSIDLEMSGVPSRVQGGNRGKQTLAERYTELKKSADKYQVLQVGLTCCKFDILNDTYILKPYNINISPLIDEKLDIERDFSFQTGAVEFLLGHGFQFNAMFTTGVQYLSREEAKLAKRLAWNRLEKKNVIEDLQLGADAVESLDFVRRVRESISAWLLTDLENLLITSASGRDEQPDVAEISRFEKRLVHQLVRAEFPHLVTISKPTYILIQVRNDDREAEYVERRKIRFKEQISKQSGFRWIVEALAHGRIDPFDPRYFARNSEGASICANMNHIEHRFRRVTQQLRDRQPVLVGHNLFTDLVYFYRTFIGQLPDTIEEFRKVIHKEFPVIVDTKYMATHQCGDLNPASSLQDVANALELQPLPIIVIDPKHPKYDNADAPHEAGYDSLLTATIAIRLSAKLEAAGNYLEKGVSPASETETSYHTAPEDVKAFDTNAPPFQPGKTEHIARRSTERGSSSLDQTSETEVPFQVVEDKATRKKRKKRKAAANQAPAGRFAHSNLFEKLEDLALRSEEQPEQSVDAPTAAVEDGRPDWARTPPPDEYSGGYSGWGSAGGYKLADPKIRVPMEVMPSFKSEFWRVYGNKLRIFGTKESVLELSD